MPQPEPFYDDDLAFIHDVGFTSYIAGCAPGLLDTLKAAQIADGLVLDLGCGGGIWAESLWRAGYHVLGVDVSPACVKLARERVPAAEFQVGSLWDFEFPSCQAVTAIGEVLCYRTSDRSCYDLRGLIQRMFEALEPGGLLIFDVAMVGLDRRRAPAWVTGDDWANLVRFEYDISRDQLTRHITSFRQTGELYRRSEERHVVQLYRRTEVTKLLRDAGFRVRSTRRIGTFPLLRRRIGFIARKP